MNDVIHRLYERLPVVFQHVAVSIRGMMIESRRFDRNFERVFQEVERRGSFSGARLRQYRERRLKAFLRETSRSLFWRRKFTEHDVEVGSNEPFDELSKLPILTKPVVKNRIEEISLASEVDGDVIDRHTSGTTGSGLQFVETREAESEQWAVWWRYRGWHGLDRKTWYGTFGGRQIVPTDQTKPPPWRFNLPGRQIRFSNYHLSPKHAESYAEAIRSHRLPWLHGYPSALALLGEFVLEQDLGPFPDVAIVTTGAENLLASQRETIREAFECPVRQHYGLAEGVANFSECEHGRLHVDEDFAAVEFVPLEDQKGHRIVGTNWTNPAFPLLRYDTGDIAILADDQECSCGRPGRIVESINGRQEDYVVVPSGARVGRLDHIFKDLVAVREAQIYQPDRGRVIFRVVKGAEYDKRNTEERLLAEARDRLGTEIDLEVKYCEEIERTDAGKIRFVVSDLDSMEVGNHD